jgi:hypothetical protein
MKDKLILTAALLTAMCFVPVAKPQLKEKFQVQKNKLVMMQPVTYDETEAQAQAAWDEFNKFASDHNLVGGYQHPNEDSWSLALFVGEDSDVPKWAVYDYSNLTDAVKQIESDYATYPDGHETHNPNA